MVSLKLVSRMIGAAVALVMATSPALAQQSENYVLDEESQLWIDGTSTRSDWTVYAEDIEGNFALVVAEDALQIEQVEFAVRAADIVSRRSTIMDRLIDDALLVDEHPIIRYDLSGSTPGATPSTYTTEGTLTMGGETRDVQFEVTAERLDDGKIRFTGTHPVIMSEYGLQAPVAMFGALRTGDEVTVHFDVVVAPEN